MSAGAVMLGFYQGAKTRCGCTAIKVLLIQFSEKKA